MMWGLVGVVLVIGVLLAWDRWGAARDAARLPQPADPLVDRAAMLRYHRALRSEKRR